MLQKNKSTTIAKFKFLLVVPVLAMMLIYVSCSDERDVSSDDPTGDIDNLISKIQNKDNLSEDEKIELVKVLQAVEEKMEGTSFKEKNKVYEVRGWADTNDVPFAVIEEVPVFPGCADLKTNNERKSCMSEKITQYVVNNFDTGIGKDILDEGEITRVIVQFKINASGDVTEIKARAPHPDLEMEAKRVINSLPRMQPGKQRGKAVGVVYSLPIVFQNGGDTPGAVGETVSDLPPPPPPEAQASK
ncbi:energy transducer TonB [Zunongwangia profunda]|tara:strand:- start:4029 stop:4763 length:735 start_codon:yes stop_codon:yes gene_type:complete